MQDKTIRNQVIKSLADHLGVEPEDIDDEDSLTSDLHMRATDLTDFIESLQEVNSDAGNIDLTQIETVGELIDALGGESYSNAEDEE